MAWKLHSQTFESKKVGTLDFLGTACEDVLKHRSSSGISAAKKLVF